MSAQGAAQALTGLARGVRTLPGGITAGGTAATTAGSGQTTAILGAAWRPDNSPVPRALLRLRNVVSGQVEATTVANDMGQFAFTNVGSGTYAIEIVSESGKVLTLGHSFSVAPGETVATFVRMAPRVHWLNAIFSNSSTTATGQEGVLATGQEGLLTTGQQSIFTNVASAASSSAASTGVTAVAPEVVRPASGRQ